MKKNKILGIITLAVLILPMMAFWAPNVSAAPQHHIILPFHTSWEDAEGQAYGRENSVDLDYKKDFYGYWGPSDPLQPELGWRNSSDMGVPVPPDGTFFGYNFGSRYLMAAGYFGTSYSYCYFNLFDMTPDSDYGPPIKIREHTFINIFYRHHQLGDSMIDAQLYNSRTQQYWTLRDFYYNGQYIVDQNEKRLHPAFRYDDPIGSWQFASFDLSIIYQNDPEYWYITKIWIGFDNGIDQKPGPARTYYDMLHISYGISDKQIHTTWPCGESGDNAWVSGSIVAWDHHYTTEGNYDLKLKVTISGFDDGYFQDPFSGFRYALFPYILKVSVDADAQAQIKPKPTGVNLTERDPQTTEVFEFMYDCAALLLNIGGLPVGWVFTAAELAQKFAGLLKVPEEEPTYQWPNVDWGEEDGYPKNIAQGEVYIEVEGLSPGPNTIPITFTVDYYTPRLGFPPILWNTVSFTLNFSWSSIPTTPTPPVLSISAYLGGTTNPAPGTYTYAYGSSVTVTASPYDTFIMWYLDGTIKHENPITVTMNSDHTLIAFFGFLPWDINDDGKCNIEDIAIAAIAYGSKPGDPNWDPSADITGPTYLVPDGKVDIRDIALIAAHFGETYY